MIPIPSFDDLGIWDDLDEVSILDEEEPLDLRTDVVEIDKSLANLEAELTRLRLRRAHILASQNLIGLVPPEILAHIFELGVHEDLKLLSVISLVSRHWHDLALTTPSLWTYIVLDNQWGLGRTAVFMRKMRVCLQRSHTCKLLVDLDISYVESEELHNIMVELQPHLSRCFSFRVSAPCWDLLPPLRDHLRGLGPSLEEVHLRINASDIQEMTPFCTLLAQSCPFLKMVILENLPLICVRVELLALQQLHLMRDQQTRRSVNRRFPILFRELLHTVVTTPALEELRFHSIRTPVLTMIPSLRMLSFNLVDSPNISLFLDSTSLPSLTRLSLDLRTCHIDGAALVPFVRALHDLPQLTALSLSSPRLGFLGGQIFDLLAAGPATTGVWILPRLQALCIQHCVDVTGHELLRVVCARRGPSVPDADDIRYLKFVQCDALDPDALDQLKAVVDTVRVS
ncbi:hypothetical protein B0H21DRAFT_877003 [Amylocystis lapponica]|nr:hypothetical protein B0H21DRAFT_877003 [Amylocystis lapponica]